ncbi:MAG: GDP-mannose 4,6-dehydratase [Thermoplasmata archaeon]|nr:GDP-mannose 4,6-dehydratase [Thermoplasmata archaeon]
MRAFITGGRGFLGAHLARHLLDRGDSVVVAYHGASKGPAGTPGLERAQMMPVEITDARAVREAVRFAGPDVIFHFAGKAFVQPSWTDPTGTFETNVMGTLYLLEAVRHEAPKAKLAFAGSATEYGAPAQVPTPEDAPLRPASPYASSKAAADLLCYQYFASHGLQTFRLRIFGTTGPGKLGDACNDFASQIASVERGPAPRPVRVGSLHGRRDITDVRDTVRAFASVVERGEPGGAYNVGCGQAYSMRGILDQLLEMSAQPCDVLEEENRLRRVDEPVHLADISRLRALGWSPQIPLSTTLHDVLESWRSRSPPTVRN